jgi:2-methylisocitrate lyase-like PEP mutase family enzyme
MITIRHTTRLRQLLDGSGAIPIVGAYDALSARLVERAGFPALYVGGYALSATQLGLPDVGLLTMSGPSRFPSSPTGTRATAITSTLIGWSAS